VIHFKHRTTVCEAHKGVLPAEMRVALADRHMRIDHHRSNSKAIICARMIAFFCTYGLPFHSAFHCPPCNINQRPGNLLVRKSLWIPFTVLCAA
jgi:hypothetical protein